MQGCVCLHSCSHFGGFACVYWRTHCIQNECVRVHTAFRVRTGPGNPGKPWKISKALETPGKALEFFFYEALVNLTELYWKNKFAKWCIFRAQQYKHLKSLAIRASDSQDLLAQIQRVLYWPEIEWSQFKFRWFCFYGYSSLLNTNKYVYGKCNFSIVFFLPVHVFIAISDPIIFVL